MKTTAFGGRVVLRTAQVAALAICLVDITAHEARAVQPVWLNIEKPDSSSARLFWDSEPGKTYRLWTKTNLQSGAWTQLGDEMTADSSPSEVYLYDINPSRQFFRLEREVLTGGSVLLTNGQVLRGEVTIQTTQFASGPNTVAYAELLDIDLAAGVTNVIGDPPPYGSTNASWTIETSNMKNGPHLLQVHVFDSNGGLYTEYANDEFGDGIHVTVENPIYVPDENPMETSWMFLLDFGTTVQDGDWRVELWDETGAFFGAANGDIAADRSSDGTISIADGWIDDGSGPRPRNIYDGYPNDYFDVLIFVWPRGSIQGAALKGGSIANGGGIHPMDAGGTNGPAVKYVRSRINHRPTRRVALTAEWPIIPRSYLRNLMNGTMDTFYVGTAYLCWNFRLDNMTTDHNQSPSAEGWNFMAGPQSWTNLNAALAGGPNQAYGGSDRISHFYYFGHGFSGGIGATNGGAGAQVTQATLQQFNYWQKSNHIFVITGPPPWSGEIKATFWVKRAGCTFAFLDACNSAWLLRVLMIDMNYKNNGQPSLANLINDGNYPFYGGGWTKTKVAGVRNGQDLELGHADYSTRFISKCLVQDPVTSLPANTYRQARELARHWSMYPDTINPSSLGWTHVGCDELYIDE